MLSSLELSVELRGSAAEVAGLTRAPVRTHLYAHREAWMRAYQVHAVLSFELLPPPAPRDGEEEEDSALEGAASVDMHISPPARLAFDVAACLPYGYALLQRTHTEEVGGPHTPHSTPLHAPPHSTSHADEADAGDELRPSFAFPSALLLRDSLHSLLAAASTVYVKHKAREVEEKLALLFAAQIE
jgi:hypothetical protein